MFVLPLSADCTAVLPPSTNGNAWRPLAPIDEEELINRLEADYAQLVRAGDTDVIFSARTLRPRACGD